MRAQSHRAETSSGSLTNIAEKENLSEVRRGKSSSVGGISEWQQLRGGRKEPIPLSASPRWLGGALLWGGAQS